MSNKTNRTEFKIVSLYPSEYSHEFHQGMVSRMDVSRPKYGPLVNAYPHKIDSLASMRQRLDLYEKGGTLSNGTVVEPGNTEYLMDAANQLMIEFLHPRHPKAHYAPTDSRSSPGRTFVTGEVSDKNNNGVAQ